jgi:hypothetical protein
MSAILMSLKVYQEDDGQVYGMSESYQLLFMRRYFDLHELDQ